MLAAKHTPHQLIAVINPDTQGTCRLNHWLSNASHKATLSSATRVIGMDPCLLIDGISYSIVPELQLWIVRFIVASELVGFFDVCVADVVELVVSESKCLRQTHRGDQFGASQQDLLIGSVNELFE